MSRWLRCHDIGNGMFSDERTITIQERGNGRIDFNVLVADVREEDPAVRVKAGQIDGEWWAIIPTPQPETIPIEVCELLPA